MMEELSADQLYGMLVAVLLKSGPIGLDKEFLNDASEEGYMLCMASDDPDSITLYVGNEEEEE